MVDFSGVLDDEVEGTTSRACLNGATNQGIRDSVERTEECHQESHVADAVLNAAFSSMQKASFVGAQENVDNIFNPSEGTSLLPLPLERNPYPVESACASPQPAKALDASSPRQHQRLQSRVPLLVDPSPALQGQEESAHVSPRAGEVPGSQEGAPETLPGSARAESSVLQARADSLTRQEKNRLCAARSNERRKRALETLKLESAAAEAQVQALRDREAEAKRVNRQLKEEAASRWVADASTK